MKTDNQLVIVFSKSLLKIVKIGVFLSLLFLGVSIGLKGAQAQSVVSFVSSTASGTEAVATATLVVQLSTSTGQNAVITFASSGTATYGVDYTLATTTAVIASGTVSSSISITVLGDSLDENDETVILTISTSTNSTIGSTSTLTYTIIDDDPTPTISFSTSTSSSSESTATATVVIALSASSSFNTTVQYSVTATSTATGSGTDYTLANGTSTITAGNTTTSISISVISDALDEPDETIVLTLSNPASSTLGSTTQHVFTISDDESAPAVYLSVSTSSANEAAGSVDVGIALSATSGQAVYVQYSASGGSATNGTDYTLTAGTSTIAAGNTTGTISLTITDDQVYEGNETFTITLSTPTNASLGSTSSLTLTIVENEGPSTGGGSSAPSYVLRGAQPQTNQQGASSTSVTSTPVTTATPKTEVKTGEAQTNATAPMRLQNTVEALSISRNLMYRSRGDDVKKLQEFLARDVEIYPEGLVTGSFGHLTLKAVQRFQEKHDIAREGEPGFGNVGPKTRNKILELTSASSVDTNQTVIQTTSAAKTEALQKQVESLKAMLQELTRQLEQRLANRTY